jgi:hypothetical protein
MSEQAKRRAEFEASFAGAEVRDWLNVIAATGDWLERLTQEPRLVDRMMADLFETIAWSLPDESKEAPWRSWWEPYAIGEWSTVHGAAELEDLNAFAFYGLPFASGADKGIDVYEQRVLKWQHIVNLRMRTVDCPHLESTLCAAEGRLCLDRGEDIDPEALALLAGLNLKSVRNAMSPRMGRLSARAGLIENRSAWEWLKDKPGFRTSIWQGGFDMAELLNHPSTESEVTLEDMVFVPSDGDGTAFDPVRSRMPEGFVLGAAGRERVVTDFQSALEALNRMRTPCWRESLSNGRWILVTADRWVRKSMDSISFANVQPDARTGASS